jgi:hypothetical protein
VLDALPLVDYARRSPPSFAAQTPTRQRDDTRLPCIRNKL